MNKLLNSIKVLIPLKSRDRYRQQYRNASIFIKILIFIISKRVFLITSKFTLPTENLKLNIGCGPINLPGFINVDIQPYKHVHIVRSVDNLNTIRDNSAVLIYASHVLEHFPIDRVPYILKEWHRVLVHGGILRLSVPDFDKLLKIYEASGNDSQYIERPLMGGHANFLDYHKSLFNRSRLSHLLKNAGFKEVKEWHPVNFPELSNHKDSSLLRVTVGNESYPISLNLEAAKD